jgi:hypothetical protein
MLRAWELLCGASDAGQCNAALLLCHLRLSGSLSTPPRMMSHTLLESLADMFAYRGVVLAFGVAAVSFDALLRRRTSVGT